MNAVKRFEQAIIAELRERQLDPIGFAQRESTRAAGAGQTLTITHYGENVSTSFRSTADGRKFSFEQHTNDEAETFALEALERQPLLTIIEIDKR